MKVKYFFMTALVILMIVTVILTQYRKYKLNNIDTFYNLTACTKYKTCKKCLSAGHCAWTTDNTCVLIPQNITGHITAKLECPEPKIDIDLVGAAESSTESVPASTDGSIDVSLAQATSDGQTAQSNQLLSGVQQYVSPQSLLSQEQASRAAETDANAAYDQAMAAQIIARGGLHGNTNPSGNQNQNVGTLVKKK
jgi:hypothetical protein